MKHFMLVLSALFFGFTQPVLAGEGHTLKIENPHAYATTSVQKNGAVFLKILNEGEHAERIIAAHSPVAENIELHTHIMDGDMMMMREVEAYEVPAGDTTVLEPMGHHIMLMGLKAPLKTDESFPLTLVTAEENEISVEVMIKNPGSME